MAITQTKTKVVSWGTEGGKEGLESGGVSRKKNLALLEMTFLTKSFYLGMSNIIKKSYYLSKIYHISVSVLNIL